MSLLPVILVVVSLALGSLGCYTTNYAVSLSSGEDIPNTGIYDTAATSTHVRYHLQFQVEDYRPDGLTTLACVDSRDDHGVIGTPGGDLAEFAAGVYTYYNLTGEEVTLDGIRTFLDNFIRDFITPERPFYFHTDSTKLGYVFANVTRFLGKTVTQLPQTTPEPDEKDVWIQELTQGYAQGCGHIRLMIGDFEYYGLTSNMVIRSVIQAYYEAYWKADESDKEKFAFNVRLGSLEGKALAIVSNVGDACPDHSPAVVPNYLGSSVFVYTPNSAVQFRQNILTPFFVSASGGSLTESDFFSSLTDLLDTQLSATLEELSPVNAVNLYTIEFTASDDATSQDLPAN
eukprot:TRINITY_DN457_c0_g1_i2.p1 TRINITY_DN457_c0_g1~~TRINITY_DN457_c0_g1_i2.p1  ORF type:complete len:344 (-),score=100.09 TRINITY_DN457_c0_g1_i2:68-1099(-)